MLPRTKLPIHLKYWPRNGWSRPNSSFSSATISSLTSNPSASSARMYVVR